MSAGGCGEGISVVVWNAWNATARIVETPLSPLAVGAITPLVAVPGALIEIRESTYPKIRLKRNRLKRVILYHVKQKEAGAEKKETT